MRATRGQIWAVILFAWLVLGVSLDGAAQTKTPITFWTFFNPDAPDPRSRALKNIITGFEADNPTLSVKVETIHWGKIGSLAIQAAAAGGGPDVIQIFSNHITQHVKAGSIAPLNEYMGSWVNENKGDYLIRLQDLEHDGKIMAMPWEVRVLAALWYRKDLLEKAGLGVPRTLDELGAAGKKMATDRVHGFVVGLSESMLASALVEMFDPLMGAYGGSLYDERGRLTLATPAGEKAMRWIADLARSGAMKKTAVSMNYEDITSGFKAGTIAAAFHGTHRIGTARESKDVGQYIEMALMPGVDAKKPAPVFIAGQSLAIGAHSKQKQAAWRFIEYYLSKRGQLEAARAQMGSVRKSVYDDPYFNTKEGKELAQWRDAIVQWGKLGRYPEDFAQLAQLLARGAQDVVLRGAAVRSVLEDVATKYAAQ